MNEQHVLAAFKQIGESLRPQQAAMTAAQERGDQALQALARQLQEQQAALTAAQTAHTQFLREESTSRRREGMVDARAVQTPTAFTGKEGDWPGWSYKFVTWLARRS